MYDRIFGFGILVGICVHMFEKNWVGVGGGGEGVCRQLKKNSFEWQISD